MALEMRGECERCRQLLGHEDVAFVCSLECTYCAECAEVLTLTCPNCSGELSRRPRRRAARVPATPAGGIEALLAVATGSGEQSSLAKSG
jgi:uncharacterized protein